MKNIYTAIIAITVIFASLLPREARGQKIYYDEDTYKYDKIYHKVYTSTKNDSSVVDSIRVEIKAFDADSFRVKNGILYLNDKLAVENAVPEKSVIYYSGGDKFLLSGENVFCFDYEKKHWLKEANSNILDFYCVILDK